MSRYCNSVLFLKDAPQDVETALKRLDPYMLLLKNLAKPVLPIAASQEESTQPLEKEFDHTLVVVAAPEIVKQHEEWIQPKQQDTLFWCIFIAHHGYGEYVEVDRNYGVREMKTKKQIGEFVAKHPDAFKTTNIKITKVAMQEIRSECLTSSKETSMNCLLAMCVCYQFNVLLVESSDRFFLEYCANTDEETLWYLLKRDTFGKYSVLVEPMHKPAVEEWKQTRFPLQHHMKPIKSIGAYKVEELEELAKRIGVLDGSQKRKKAEIYEAVSDVMKWY